MQDYGFKLRAIRERMGLRQIDLADKLGVTQVTISAYERNVRYIPAWIVNKLLKMAERKKIKLRYGDLRPE